MYNSKLLKYICALLVSVLIISGCTAHKATITPDSIPEYSGKAYTVLNSNIPYFQDSDISENSFERYSTLDELGRCGIAISCIGKDLMPTGERGSIGQVKPTGWQTVKYDNVDGKYLYNRCHLIGYQLTGENANERNLITGTRYLNVTGMLPFENMVADYIKETDNHVMYRVTPVFENDNLVASGVIIEGYSVEDSGEGICFNVYCYNVQPGIKINYADGTSVKEEASGNTSYEQCTYILNRSSKKIHKPECSAVSDISEKNRGEFYGDINGLIEKGYTLCKNCM